jgi:Arc/MetJ-type ribon-helix-helix transcriptional regulator
MTTISVPLPSHLEEKLNNLVKSGYGSNKADVVRRAITRLAEEEAVEMILRAQKEISLGKGLSGDLRELAKKMK